MVPPYRTYSTVKVHKGLQLVGAKINNRKGSIEPVKALEAVTIADPSSLRCAEHEKRWQTNVHTKTSTVEAVYPKPKHQALLLDARGSYRKRFRVLARRNSCASERS